MKLRLKKKLRITTNRKQWLSSILKYTFLGGILICVIVILISAPGIIIPNVYLPYNPDSPIGVLSVIFWIMIVITVLTVLWGIYQYLSEPKEPSRESLHNIPPPIEEQFKPQKEEREDQ